MYVPKRRASQIDPSELTFGPSYLRMLGKLFLCFWAPLLVHFVFSPLLMGPLIVTFLFDLVPFKRRP